MFSSCCCCYWHLQDTEKMSGLCSRDSHTSEWEMELCKDLTVLWICEAMKENELWRLLTLIPDAGVESSSKQIHWRLNSNKILESIARWQLLETHWKQRFFCLWPQSTCDQKPEGSMNVVVCFFPWQGPTALLWLGGLEGWTNARNHPLWLSARRMQRGAIREQVRYLCQRKKKYNNNKKIQIQIKKRWHMHLEQQHFYKICCIFSRCL